jgi:ankyrin repeat protein
VARLLIEKGAEIDARDQSQRTPLHWAAEWDREAAARLLIEKMVRLLIQKGADLEARDADGATPRQLAINEDNSPLASLLTESSTGGTDRPRGQVA